MTAGDRESEARPTRRGVLLGVSLAGLGGALAGCSTAPVPYDANEAGVVPGAEPASSAMAMPAAGASSGGAMPAAGGAMGAASGKPGGRTTAGGGGKVTGTVLAAVGEIPVGGGRIFTAEKVVVTQPARGQYRAFSAVCTHVGCILDKVADGVIGCPCHGGEFKITDGTVVAGPPPTPLPRERIKIVDGKVVLL
jgi:Rieske Fe-S protein